MWRGERVLCPVDVDSIEKVVSSLESPDIFMRRTRFMEDNFRKITRGAPSENSLLTADVSLELAGRFPG